MELCPVEIGGMRCPTESLLGRMQSGKKNVLPGPLRWENRPGHFGSFSNVVHPLDDPQIHVDKPIQA